MWKVVRFIRLMHTRLFVEWLSSYDCWNENNVEELGSGKHPLFCNASVKGGEHFIKNKIFSYSMDETWEDILKDLLEDW
jgi:hypothetical protein